MAQGRGGAIVASAAVLALGVGFASYVWKTERGPVGEDYPLAARFVSANGLTPGADVDLAGVPVGKVGSISLDPETQMAIVHFRIDRRLSLPSDSVLTVGAPSMTGDNALLIEPGHGPERLASGALVTNTREPLSLEQQVSNYIFGAGSLGQ
ncbi:toluene ABC transporter periplasmic protein [Ameyamaea chiangmaiensis NBRC 103196]|uniref:MCE family protein n=1 Tax=Ameyamaea chiangmaiensis TaxID=442969 RepID=A0A850P566_9PROT|nr:MlaD family protein [Ameyamaea chiangmaiensis]MBS4073723.1 MCE family protein [Ameyamaea chiangmaiensis]NVN39785.1 MCE family protein [Ameyamaea chiangmaiensis]GBQ68685.1 toluene ABC transporter periplasmic protein [Ameyamaea chiangmaiensis NBRC 103196]